MSERKSVESSSSKTQHVEIILEFGHKATLKDAPIKVSLYWWWCWCFSTKFMPLRIPRVGNLLMTGRSG